MSDVVQPNTHQANASKQAEEPTVNKTKKTPKSPKSPKGWIRWSGIVLLIVILGGLFALGYLLSSLMLKNKVENLASQAWGAKVEIQQLGFSFNPLGIRIEKLAVTDPEQPMQNLFVIDDITLTVNLYHLVVKRFVVEDLRLQGLALDVPRKTSGALPLKPIKPVLEEGREGGVFNLPSVNLPGIDEILARERLETLALASALKDQSEQAAEQWKAIEQRLPREEQLKQYKIDIDRLFDGSVRDLEDLKQRQEALKTLQQRWVQDKLAIRDAQNFVRNQTRDLRQGMGDLVDMPRQDVNRIMATYSFDEEGLSNITYLLFGETVQEKLDLALDWYRKAQPLIAWVEQYRADQAKAQPPKSTKPPRSQGETIAFVEFDPQPKFMIKRIDFDGKLNWGDLVAHVRDVNFDHAFSQKPVRFNVSARPQTQANPLILEGQSTNLGSQRVITQVKANWADYQIKDWRLSDSSRLPIKITEAQNQFSAEASFEGVRRMDVALIFDYQNTRFDLSEATSRDVQRYMAPAFESINAFKVEAGLSGRIYAPRFSASSDLDRHLTSGFKQVFQQELAQLKQDLEQKLRAELAVYQASLEQRVIALGVDEEKVREVAAHINDIEAYAQAQAKEAEQALRQRARDELDKVEAAAREKLDQERAKLEAEKKQAEEEAKKKLEQELRQRLRF
ncbi:TIGR03545 family protein [Thiomicrospira sp. R3]|uniref:TIGR03545 family protein n=1 Tax=Thiomicrospira sp. R3 TaxID=3035472 RepID=UPI00259B73A8|nr:TIGR03545 family protein [Thiomicrospira sp. R3]WFE69215.1 TIGR03545 family protein [Thiomicrospira sp. R3]